MNDLNEDGTITPSGRFARMEAALNRIEDKLDSKAETARVEALEVTVDNLEARMNDYATGRITTPNTQEYLRRFQAMEQALTDLQRHGSPEAQEAVTAVARLGSRIEALELSESNRGAIASALKETADVRYRTLMWVVGLVSILNVIVALIGMFFRPSL